MQKSYRKFLLFKRIKKNKKPWILVFDVDGVLTDGKFEYTSAGKKSKTFGSYDSEALSLATDKFNIKFITADKRGFLISEKRIKDMGFELLEVSSSLRLDYIRKLQKNYSVAFTADSFTDVPALQLADLSFAPQNSHPLAKKNAYYVLSAYGGDGAVSEVIFFFLRRSY